MDADRRQYKRNKFLVYITAGAIGLTFAGALCFIPLPNAPAMVKNILFVAGYIIWDAFYTVANVPYGSMLPLISSDPVQRAQLSTFRSAGSMIAGVLTGILIPILIYDSDSNLLGDRLFVIALIMGVLGLGFCTDYRYKTAMNCFGALTLGVGLYGLQGAVLLRLADTVLGVTFALVFAAVFHRLAGRFLPGAEQQTA